MKKYFVILTVFFTSHSYSQVNLIVNPSFEDTVFCPTGYNQINRALGWDILLTGGGGNPDMYHSCCNPNICGVPYNH